MPAATIIRADHPQYWRWQAAAARRQATILGYAYDPDGVKKAAYTTWVSRTRRNPDSNEMQSVLLGDDFLTKALDDYGDWTKAWWREAIQNCVDAGATIIKLNTKTLPDGRYEVTVTDNGKGMSADILFKKYLSLGSTGKKDTPTATGGFGEAKRLLLFPWCQWSILTNGPDGAIGVVGQGFTYKKIPHLDANGTGTSLIITMPADKHVDPADAEWFINKCYLPNIKIYLNGTKIDADFELGDSVTSKKVSPDWLLLYYTPKARKNRGLFVRKNGLLMFEEYAPDIKGCLIVEIVPPSVEVLKSSRDGFNYRTPCASQLDQYKVDISKNTSSALKKSKAEHTLYEGGRTMVAKVQDTQGKLFDALSRHFGGSVNQKIDSQTIKDMEVAIAALPQHGDDPGMMAPTPGVAGIVMKDMTKDETTVIEAAASQLSWPADFYIVNNIGNYNVPMWLRPCHPKTKQPTMDVKPQKVARLWMEYCRLILIRLGYKEQFGVGWILSANDKTKSGYAGAAYLFDHGRHWLLLNPFIGGNIDAEKTYSIREPKHLNDLFALAVHECTHLVNNVPDHDEEFSSAMTMNMAKVMPSAKLMLAIRDAVAARRDEQKTVERANTLDDLVQEIVNRAIMIDTQPRVMASCKEIVQASADMEQISDAAREWLKSMNAVPAYLSFPNHIGQILDIMKEDGLKRFGAIRKMLETVPKEIVPNGLTFNEFRDVVAYQAWQTYA